MKKIIISLFIVVAFIAIAFINVQLGLDNKSSKSNVSLTSLSTASADTWQCFNGNINPGGLYKRYSCKTDYCPCKYFTDYSVGGWCKGSTPEC